LPLDPGWKSEDRRGEEEGSNSEGLHGGSWGINGLVRWLFSTNVRMFQVKVEVGEIKIKKGKRVRLRDEKCETEKGINRPYTERKQDREEKGEVNAFEVALMGLIRVSNRPSCRLSFLICTSRSLASQPGRSTFALPGRVGSAKVQLPCFDGYMLVHVGIGAVFHGVESGMWLCGGGLAGGVTTLRSAFFFFFPAQLSQARGTDNSQ
jgi:hypothetical protein